MILKILGILDIITALIFWLFAFFNIIPSTLLLILAFYLLVKGVVFVISRDVASILDIFCAGIILLSLNFQMPKFITIIIVLFLIQKGVFSLIA